jgi:processive 1,2-diacylglycerol beta-glucosyltransferase
MKQYQPLDLFSGRSAPVLNPPGPPGLDLEHGPGPWPRVLVLSASIGTGHLRAAEALVLALRQLVPEATVQSVDVLNLATPPLRFGYAQVYLDLIRWAPSVLGMIYNKFDRPRRREPGFWYYLKVWLEKLNMGAFVALLQSQPWDVVISTFFLPAEIIAALRRGGQFQAPQVLVVTDFESHGNWVTEPCDLYCTATEEAARYLEWFGVPAEATAVTGIPIHPVFAGPKDPAACRARQGLAGGRPVVLLLAGGHGAGPVEEPFRALLETELPLELVAVAGHNAPAREKLAAVEVPARHRVHVLGFTDQMDELLAAADLVVTKPGGLTVCEALARGAAMLLINPIPGQEERNSDYLLEQGAAVKVNHMPTLAFKVAEVLRDPGRLDRLKANARRLARPRAAFTIAERALRLVRTPASGCGMVSGPCHPV